MSSVLLIDDEPVVLRVAQLALEGIGLSVRPALDLRQARTIFHQHKQNFDVLLCDISMPGGSGLDLAREFQASNPELKVMLMSGQVDEAELNNPGSPGFAFIAKPFLPSVLQREMKGLLAA